MAKKPTPAESGPSVDVENGLRIKKTQEKQTKQVRLYEDVAEMLSWLAKMVEADTGKNWSTARFLDPHVRPIVEAAYEPYRSRVEKIKKALDE